MLDMLLTADAAHKHGQDASPLLSSSSPEHASNGSFLVNVPLSIVGSFLRLQPPSPSPAPAPRSADSVEATANAPNATTPQGDVMKAALDTQLVSPAPSRPVSSGSSATADDRPKKRAPRSKTSYICARPARPVDCRSKLHIRPKVLLQLHQVIPLQRPKPTYEVIPFSLLPPRSTRRLARTFNTRDRLGPNDLLIVKAEAYGNNDEDTKSDDDRWGSRDVIGVICLGKSEKETTEICMDDGTSRWAVTNMPNGGFEFNTTDEHGLALKARWVPKPAHSRRVSGMSVSSQLSPTFQPGPDERKYTFSTISPNSRRHPIIATMTRTRIDVMDSYVMPSATSPPTPALSLYTQSPAQTPASIDKKSFIDNSSDQFPIKTDDALRRFIVVSGSWIASRSCNSSNTSSQPPTPSLETSATLPLSNNRTVSMSFLDSPRSASPASTIDEKRRSFPRMLRTGTGRLPRSTSFTEPSSTLSLAKVTPNTSPSLKTRSRRANSTGNTALYSMTGSMRMRYGLAFEDQALPESEEERQIKRSVELLRIKELTIPSPVERSSSETPYAEPKPRATPTIPSPIVIPPSSNGPTSPTPLPSPLFLSAPIADPERARKTQSAYSPVDTAGLWDSGVTERPGLNSRPTSMFVINERKRKEEKKRERSKGKEGKKFDNDKGHPMKKHVDWRKLGMSLKGLFKRDKAR